MQREHPDMLVRRKYKKYSKQKMTYLGLIAYVIQNAPQKKLMFHELMNAVTIFVDGDRKGLENNIRVCLSANNCFVKVPINPECPNAKRNFWKVDDSKITPKILRRHFSGLRNVFPDFCESMEIPSVKNATDNKSTFKRPEAEKKFTSPFSIESLLQRESSAPVRHRPVLCATRSLENSFVGLANGDRGLACKRKTWDWPNQTDFSGSFSHFSFPTYSLGQMNDGCSTSGGPSKRMHSVSELSYCTAPESIRQFTSNAVSWAYM
ncbi:forkhead box protein H1-like [Sinocyclocheilus grahami]|uniref:forkhead box protein H1-like n=1 Tax=Sinocyclocheilus grahami TaxID=75366 RepID=UPI0007ACC2BA|nr:PREDICTED: forkhead box protein H1-like [Sinocyclocheilus grahami]